MPAPWGPIAALFAMAGLPGPTFPTFGLAPTLVTTTGVVTTAMAFGLFGRRRREDDEASDELMAVAAARGLEFAPAAIAGAASPAGPRTASTPTRQTRASMRRRPPGSPRWRP